MIKLLRSSADPTKLSLTVKGILTAFVPLILLFSGLSGSDITQGDLQEVIDSVISAITAIFGAFAAVITVLGAFRKVKNKIRKK